MQVGLLKIRDTSCTLHVLFEEISKGLVDTGDYTLFFVCLQLCSLTDAEGPWLPGVLHCLPFLTSPRTATYLQKKKIEKKHTTAPLLKFSLTRNIDLIFLA